MKKKKWELPEGMLDGYPDVLEIKDVRKILDIGERAVYKLLQSGELKSIKVAGKHRIPKLYLAEYILRGYTW